MKKIVLTCIFLCLLISCGDCGGYDIKTSSVIDQPGAEVLGYYNGSWYAIGFQAPGNLNKPPQYQLLKYSDGFHSAKISPLNPSFGEKTVYLRSAIINNRISMFYARCDRRVEESALLDPREGHRQMQVILRQDYDPNTLESLGDPQTVFNEDNDYFSSSGIDIGESNDGTKSATLVKCYFRQSKYKVIVSDNHTGQIYSKVFDIKPVKDMLKFLSVKVSNGGQVLIAAKVRDDVVTMTSTSKDKKPALYYFFYIDKNGGEPKMLSITSPEDRDKYPSDPVISMLNNGEMLIAHTYSQTDKNPVAKGISIAKYDVNFNLTGTKDLSADSKLAATAAEFQKSKKENGFLNLEIRQVLPLQGGSFMLVTEYRHSIEAKEKNTSPVIERNYLLTYRLDDKLDLKEARFIPKKQSSATVNYAFSTQAYGKGNDVYLFHNDDWPTEEEHSMEFQCTYLSANGGEPETKKIMRTSEDFFTSLEHIYPTSEGKFLLTEEKLVDFEGVSREIKLLEITVK